MTISSILILCSSVACFFVYTVIWFTHLVAIIYGKWKLHREEVPSSPEDLPGVSIIKPLTGVDPNLKSNLDTFFNLKYPAYEILFGVENEQDPAVLLVKSLMEAYPKVDARLFIGIKDVGVNGKINNMMKPYENSKYDVILISDSGLRMRETALMNMVCCLKKNVGMVLQMPYACSRKGFAGIYEQVYFGTMSARIFLSAIALGINASTGMSCMMTKEALEKAGGLAFFGKYMAEDFFFAAHLIKLGYKIRMSADPALQNPGTYSIPAFHKRLVRWSYLRLTMLPHLYILEPLSECVMLGAIISLVVQYLFGTSPLVFFLLHILCWFLFDYTLLSIIENGPLPFTKFEFLVAWFLRETSTFYILLQSYTSKTIGWRNRRYLVRFGGVASEVKDEIV